MSYNKIHKDSNAYYSTFRYVYYSLEKIFQLNIHHSKNVLRLMGGHHSIK